MESVSLLRFIFAFVAVLGLIGLMALALRKWGSKFLMIKEGAAGRLSVVETCYLGPRHRLMLVKRDNVEHLLLLGTDSQEVVETGIKKDA